jgi:hypothetical protein
MSLDDAELMLWAIANGWSVKMFAGDAPGSLWRDPARRRYLVHARGAAPGLPALSDEVRARIAAARAASASPLQSLQPG